jgi:outer membrane biosynthesis protein TonB
MSGRRPPAFVHAWPASGALGGLRSALNPDRYLRRFYAALMFSCLLHAALVFLPYFGARTTASGPAVQAGQKPGRTRILSVRFMAENATAPTSAQPGSSEEPRPAPEHSPGIDLLPIPAPAFYTADQLTKRPQLISDPRLHSPDSDPFPGTGKVVLKVRISELGMVISVDVEKSDVPEAVAATAAAAFGDLRFIPGEINGRRVGSILRIEVTYDDPARDEGARDNATGSPP